MMEASAALFFVGPFGFSPAANIGKPSSRIASASRIVRRGLLRTFSKSSSLRVMPYRSTTNESAPTSETIADETIAFMPWMSDTTVTIEVTGQKTVRVLYLRGGAPFETEVELKFEKP